MKKKHIIWIIIAAWILIPTGTPDDIITFSLIEMLGKTIYIFLLVIIAVILIKNKVTPKKAKRTIKKWV